MASSQNNHLRIVGSEELPSGGGPGDNGGMDKLAHLEQRVDQIDSRLGRIEGDMADVKVALAGLDAKLDIGSIRASVEKAHTDIYKWVASLAIGAIVLGLSVYFGVQRLIPYQLPSYSQQQTGPTQGPNQAPPQ